MKEIPCSEDGDLNVVCTSCGATVRVKMVDNRKDKSNNTAFIAQCIDALKTCLKCGGAIH